MKQPPKFQYTNTKVDFIQSWRGIAVLLVVYYHFTNRVPPQYLNMEDGPTIVFHAGKVGVLIFFVISGYLIAKSLVTSNNLAEFYAKRVSRIWPLFIFASVFIFLFLQFFEPPVVSSGPKTFFAEERNWVDLIGTLFFLEDLGFRWMDGVFWSILVELKFYFWIGLLAWFRPNSFVRNFAIIATGLGLLVLGLGVLELAQFAWLAKGLNGLFIAQYLPFFAIGALLVSKKHPALLTILLIIAFVQTALKSLANPDFNLTQSALFLILLTMALTIDRLLFRSRIILHIGDHSYGFYLFHQIIGLSLIKLLGGLTSYDAALVFALLTTYGLAMIASWMAEWRFRQYFTGGIMTVFRALGINRMDLPTGDRVLR